jgi:hypothetical protein
MRRLCITLTAAGLVVGLGGPAWASAAPTGMTRGVESHHRAHDRARDQGGNNYQGTSASGSADPPGEGRSHYDQPQHDDPNMLF